MSRQNEKEKKKKKKDKLDFYAMVFAIFQLKLNGQINWFDGGWYRCPQIKPSICCKTLNIYHIMYLHRTRELPTLVVTGSDSIGRYKSNITTHLLLFFASKSCSFCRECGHFLVWFTVFWNQRLYNTGYFSAKQTKQMCSKEWEQRLIDPSPP